MFWTWTKCALMTIGTAGGVYSQLDVGNLALNSPLSSSHGRRGVQSRSTRCSYKPDFDVCQGSLV